MKFGLNNLEHGVSAARRGLVFHAFSRLYHAHRELIQGLFIAHRKYPIAYDKWVKEQVVEIEAALRAGASAAGRSRGDVETWYVACLDCAERRDTAFAKLGNILGFVAAYVLGPDPEARGVPAALIPAVHELRRTYTTRQRAMDGALVERLGLFDYLRARLAVAGTPDDCVDQVRAAAEAGVERLMFTVSLAADPVRAVELFGRHVLPELRRSTVAGR